MSSATGYRLGWVETRDRVLGVRTDSDAQYIFVDTPGFQRRHRSALNTRMNHQVTGALNDVDAIVAVAGRPDRMRLELSPLNRPFEEGFALELPAQALEQARLTADPTYYPKADGAFASSLRLHPVANADALVGQASLAAARHERIRWWSLKMLAVLGISFEHAGTPARGGCLLAINHVSYVDPLTFAHVLHDYGRLPRYLAKAGLFDVFFVGTVFRATGQIPVYRMTTDASQAFRAAVAAVEDGKCVAVYPEGTLTREADLWPMVGKTGAARIALAAGVPVIPIAQWGPQDILWPYAARLRLLPRKTVVLKAGDPVASDDRTVQPSFRCASTPLPRSCARVVRMKSPVRRFQTK